MELSKKGLHKDLCRDDVSLIHWAIAGQIYCVPFDLDEEEFVRDIAKPELGDEFKHCPEEYVADRVAGGVECPLDPERRHVILAAGYFSYTAAARGKYWELDANAKFEIAQKYREAAEHLWVGDGPFTEMWK